MLNIALLAKVVAAGTVFSCTPVAVWDGDGPVWCRERPHLRIAGIAAREMDGSCRAHQPCPAASAEAARDALVQLLGVKIGVGRRGHILIRPFATLRCLSSGDAKRDRTGAWCTMPDGRALSCAMIGTGTVLPWAAFMRGRSCSQAPRSRD